MSDESDSYFSEACEYVTDHADSLNSEQLVLFYGFYKQATAGPCNTPKPSLFDLRAKKMWTSWSNLGSMPKAEAKLRYVELLNRIAGDWQTSTLKAQGWVCVSSPRQEEQIADSAKDIFDWTREGNLEKIRQACRVSAANSRDADGLTLLHWAADRGHLPVVRYLVAELKTDVNCLDKYGQTPLHYAAACGYLDVCKFLVDSRAEVAAADGEGLTPIDLAEEASVKNFLERL